MVDEHPEWFNVTRFRRTDDGRLVKITKTTKYKVGDGWKKIIWTEAGTPEGWADYKNGESSSEGCVLLAVKRLCQCVNLDIKQLYLQAYPKHGFDRIEYLDDLEKFAEYTIMPEVFDGETIEKLMEDLGDINHHSLRRLLENKLKNKPVIFDTKYGLYIPAELKSVDGREVRV